ncbi:hypothetical protein CGCTS75_v013432 [Colletotrichum tropicale]|nr:hypothetical protein CGCTS75_v013432 [Colletotrichum tropicale]
MFSPPFVCDSSVVGNCCTKRPVHTEKTLLPDGRSICDTTPSSQRPLPFSQAHARHATAHMHGRETHIHPPDISRKVRRTSVGQVAFDGRHSSTPLHFLALYPANQHSQQPVLRFLILDTTMSPLACSCSPILLMCTRPSTLLRHPTLRKLTSFAELT